MEGAAMKRVAGGLVCAVMAAGIAGAWAADGGRAERAGPVALTYSSPDMDKTPADGMAFHGPFGRETFIATADKLPAHDFLEISCDVLIIRTWDGSTQITQADLKPAPIGPDFFRMGIHGGPTLLYTTFCNMPDRNDFKGDKTQNYPSQVPGDLLTPGLGSVSKNKLGYNYPDLGPSELVPMDALYHVHFIVPHHEGQALVEFTGLNLQDLHDESWGVANVEVRALAASQVEKPDEAAIAKAMAVCARADEKTDLSAAFETLVVGMDKSVAWMSKNVKPVPIDASGAPELIKALAGGDEQAANRESAHASLVKMGIQVEPLLRDARRDAVGELRLRLDWALMALDVEHHSEDDLRRVMVATRALEIIGTPEALALRKKLTQE
jgi:hypothetical protein